jgi:uncharacterized protein (TIGR04255 family)
MPFPESPRVVYDRNPLESVICQLRYPDILRIDSEIPSQFQELVRREYPLFEHKQGPTLPIELSKIVGKQPPFTVRSGYDFTSGDGQWTLGLTAGALSLKASRYANWTEFRERVVFGVSALQQVYQPAFYTRLGLRYRNVIIRSILGLGNAPWDELLQPHIAGELQVKAVAPHIASAVRNVIINLSNGVGHVLVQHGLGEMEGGEQVYIIDSDFFVDTRVEVSDAFKTLDQFNRRSGHLFRWCICTKLHQALGPQATEPVGVHPGT